MHAYRKQRVCAQLSNTNKQDNEMDISNNAKECQNMNLDQGDGHMTKGAEPKVAKKRASMAITLRLKGVDPEREHVEVSVGSIAELTAIRAKLWKLLYGQAPP
jgi:hypothetical protein